MEKEKLIFVPNAKENIDNLKDSYLCKQILSDYFEYGLKDVMFVHPYIIKRRIPDFCQKDFEKIID